MNSLHYNPNLWAPSYPLTERLLPCTAHRNTLHPTHFHMHQRQSSHCSSSTSSSHPASRCLGVHRAGVLLATSGCLYFWQLLATSHPLATSSSYRTATKQCCCGGSLPVKDINAHAHTHTHTHARGSMVLHSAATHHATHSNLAANHDSNGTHRSWCHHPLST